MSDGRRFDELTRIWATPMSRRRALRLSAGAMFGGVVIGSGLLSSGPAQASVACSGDADCGVGAFVCCKDAGCSNPGTCTTLDKCCGQSACIAPDHGHSGTVCAQSCCGQVCCGSGMTCCGGACVADTDVCCGGTDCPSGTTCCGSSCGCGGSQTCISGSCCDNAQVCGSVCCPQSTVCLNPATGACGCPAGGSTCGSFCCKKGETCADPSGGCCCPKGSTPCGQSCCAAGVVCLDPANSICGCQKGTTPCGTAASLTCCSAGQACASGCPPPANNTVSGYCSGVHSDRNLKEHVLAVVWERI
jgi:hypothetical protein